MVYLPIVIGDANGTKKPEQLASALGQINNLFVPIFLQYLHAAAVAFLSEVDTGSREENASKQQSRATLLIHSEAKL
jgi:hypothetical protein